jgi:TolA-binding protein
MIIVSLLLCIPSKASTLSKKIKINKKTFLTRPKENTSNEFQGTKAKLLAKRRNVLITDLKEALKTSKDRNRKSELELRLANLYLEEYKFKVGMGEDGRFYLKKAKGLLANLLSEHPAFERNDETKFQLAQLHLEFSEQEKANKLFLNIVTDYPQSPFSSECYLQLADDAFVKNKFDVAIRYYAPLLKQDNSVGPYAHYKSAWAFYNLGQLLPSIEHFKTVINLEPDSHTSSHTIALKKEAMRDLCLPLGEAKIYEEGRLLYSSEEESAKRLGLECLAGIASEKGDFQEALSLYTELIKMDSHAEQNPRYSLAIIDIYKKSNQPQKLYSFFEKSLDFYLGNSSWNEIHSNTPAVINETKTFFEDTLKTITSETHSVAQKTKNSDLYLHSKNFYSLYLKHFSLTAFAPQAHFYLAEILFKQKDFSPAARAYHSVFTNNLASSQLKKTAIEYALLSRLEEINLERKRSGQAAILNNTRSKRTNESTDDSPIVFSEAESHFIELSEAFVSTFPKSPKAPEALFRASYLKYIHFENKAAYQDFWRLVKTYPKDKTAVYAGSLLLDILNQRQDFSNLVEASKALLVTKEISDLSFRQEVSDILRKSELKLISLKESSGEFDQAASQYLSFISKYGSQDRALHETALYNASVCLTKANRLDAALKTQETFLKTFSKSKLRSELLLQVAKSYEAQANFNQAARYFALFHDENPKHPQSSEALRLAGLYFWGAGQRDKAEKTMLNHLAIYPDLKETTEKDLIDFYAHEGLHDQLKQYLLTERSKRGVSFSKYLILTLRLIDLQQSPENKQAQLLWKEADRLVSQHEKLLLQTIEGSQSVGKVLLKRVSNQEALFSSLRLADPAGNQEKLLAKKLTLISELEKQFGHIASLGGEAGLAALYKTAALYSELSHEISEAPIPDGLTADQIDVYRQELSKQMVTPFKEKALGFATQCLDKAQELSIASSWVARCYGLAAKADPVVHRPLLTFSLPPYYTAYLSSPLSNQKIDSPFYHSFFLFSEKDKEQSFFQPGLGVTTLSLQPYLPYRETKLQTYLRVYPSPENPEHYFKNLNASRLNAPEKAILEIKSYLTTNPSDPSFHNLLALSYLETKEFEKAKVTWLSLLARGFSDPAISNNLGVLEALRGNEEEALAHWNKAGTENLPEALINQGFVALSYRNGSLAKSFFERAQDHRKDELAEIGTQISNLQIRADDDTKRDFINFAEKFPQNPVIESQISALTHEGRALASDKNGLPEL